MGAVSLIPSLLVLLRGNRPGPDDKKAAAPSRDWQLISCDTFSSQHCQKKNSKKNIEMISHSRTKQGNPGIV
jgi:hypothetical protein